LSMVVMNNIMQLYFCTLIAVNLGGVEEIGLSDKDMLNYLHWRVSVAHHVNHYDPVSDTSLASRVCDGFGGLVSAELQKNSADNFDAYLGNGDLKDLFLGGPGLCLLALACWFCLVSEDILSNFEFSYALLSITGGRTLITPPSTMQMISWDRLIGILLVVCIPRLVVSLCLFFFGALFLVHTAQLSDLILNAMALGFVMDLDNLLFTYLPSRVRSAVQHMEPLELKSFLGKINITFVRPSFLLVTAVCIFLSHQLLLSDVITRMSSAQDILCGGNRQFVYVLDAATGVSHHGLTSEPPDLPLATYTFSAMLEQTELDGDIMSDFSNILLLDGWEFEGSSLSVDSIASTVRLMNGYSEEEALNKLTCTDNMETSAYIARGREVTGDDNLTSCAELADLCTHSVVRALCQETCGCNSMFAGLYSRSGCSSTCDSLIKEEVLTVAAAVEGVGSENRKCVAQGDSREWMETFVNELQAAFVSDGTLEEVRGFYRWTDEFKTAFLDRTYTEYGLLNVSVNLSAWLNINNGQGLCDAVSFFDNLFLTNLCSTDASLADSKGTLEGLCPNACGLCENADFGGTSLSMSDLLDLQNVSVVKGLFAHELFEELSEIVFGCGSEPVSGTTDGQTSDFGDDGPDVAYRFITDEDQEMVYFSTCNDAAFDTILKVYTVDYQSGNFTLLVTEDDTPGCGSTSVASLPVSGDELYLVVVDGYDASSGEFLLSVTCIPAV